MSHVSATSAPLHGADIRDFDRQGLTNLLDALGEPKFRAKQLFQWLWRKGAPDFAAMTSLSKELRVKLAQRFTLHRPQVAALRESRDGTLKLLLELADGARIETVFIPEKDHFTQCLSTQVGCALECTFCATGTMGLVRNLTHGEICGQVLAGREALAELRPNARLRNLVFMGMGEPLMNYDTLVTALRTITDDQGLGFSTRRVTVSTAGVPGKMLALGQTGLASLAVSLHAPTQELREAIMPKAARMLPLDELMTELKAYPIKPRERITFEYILLAGVNDSPQHARELVRLLSHVKAKVNLIAYNPGPDCDGAYRTPDMDAVEAFEQVLRQKHMTVILRRSKGQDIDAACGQLAAKHATQSGAKPPQP